MPCPHLPTLLFIALEFRNRLFTSGTRDILHARSRLKSNRPITYPCADSRPRLPALSEAEGSQSSAARPSRPVLLARLRRSPLLAHRLDALQRELQPFPPDLGTRDDLLDVPKHLRVPHLFTQLFEERMNLRKY